MDEKIQQQILSELKSLSVNLSLETVPELKSSKPLFAQTLIDHIFTMEENIKTMFDRLARIEDILNKK
jgi:hypothetical protein